MKQTINFIVAFLVFVLSACQAEKAQETDTTIEQEMNTDEIATLDSAANSAEELTQEIKKSAENLDSLLKDLDN